MSAQLFVAGATGLIGSEVCRVALRRGHRVVGLARNAPGGAEPWQRSVQWVEADVFEPEAWRASLVGCTGVVHCIGIIRQRPAAGITFARMNGEAAILLGREAVAAGVQRFAFLSARAQPPLVDPDYLAAKRRAEQALREMRLASSLLRPGMVVGRGRLASLGVGALLGLAARIPGARALADPYRPLPVSIVARCAVRAAVEPDIEGILEVEDIQRLGSVADPG